MKRTFFFMIGILGALSSSAEPPVHKIPLEGATAVGTQGKDAQYGTTLTVSSGEHAGKTFPIAILDHPGITAPRYAISGYVRYDGISQPGFLELWNHFGDKGHFFSRTMGSGLMAPLSGDSGWRRFALPFYAETPSGGKLTPERLEFNVVLPADGTVTLAGLELHQFSSGEDPIASLSGAWWSEQKGGLFGAGGSIVGLWGAVIGFLAYRKTGREIVLLSLRLFIVAGATSVAAGIYAASVGQPTYILFPLFLLGAILSSVGAFNYTRVRRFYTEIEERRMMAHDAKL